jgi:hypothetical protein
MIREDKNSRLNIWSNLVQNSTFAHHEHHDHFKSSFKKRRRDSDSNDIYVSFSSLFLTRLFSMIISRRSVNVKNTHVKTNLIVFSSHILTFREKVTTTKTRAIKTRTTKARATKMTKWFNEKTTLRDKITTINMSTWDFFQDLSSISLRS